MVENRVRTPFGVGILTVPPVPYLWRIQRLFR